MAKPATQRQLARQDGVPAGWRAMQPDAGLAKAYSGQTAATSDQTRRVRATAQPLSGRETEPAREIAAPTKTRTPACTEPKEWLTRVRIEARAEERRGVCTQEAAKSGLTRTGLLIEEGTRRCPNSCGRLALALAPVPSAVRGLLLVTCYLLLVTPLTPSSAAGTTCRCAAAPRGGPSS